MQPFFWSQGSVGLTVLFVDDPVVQMERSLRKSSICKQGFTWVTTAIECYTGMAHHTTPAAAMTLHGGHGHKENNRLQASLLCASTPCPYLYIVSREVALWRGAWCSLLETSRKKKESAALE